MGKVIPVHSAGGNHTMSGAIELHFTALDGKKFSIALMPSLAIGIANLIERLRDEPDTTAIETLSPALRKVLRAMAAKEPLRSGGFRVAANMVDKILYLQVAQSDGTVAEIPLDRDYAGRLIQHLGRAIDAIAEPSSAQ